MHWAAFAVLGYLAGSIPFGLLLTRMAGLGDVRNIGSGNIGATNVLRTGNKKIAALTLLLDGLKGFIPVMIASHYDSESGMIAAGLGALAGHLFPVWLKFKGGKGVSTSLGVIFAWSWMLGLLFCVAWLAVFLSTRFSSASALGAILVVALAAIATSLSSVGWWPIAVCAAAIWFMHRANIMRLANGQEPRSTFSKST